MCVAHGQVPPLTRYFMVLTFSSTTKMNAFASGNGDGKEFVSHAPGYWPEVAPELWNDWKWQLKNRVTSLAQLESGGRHHGLRCMSTMRQTPAGVG